LGTSGFYQELSRGCCGEHVLAAWDSLGSLTIQTISLKSCRGLALLPLQQIYFNKNGGGIAAAAMKLMARRMV
jgi:hypothetical protein